MQNRHVELRQSDRVYLEGLVTKGIHKARVLRRANGLLELDRGKTLHAVSNSIGVSRVTVATWRNRYIEQGLKCLDESPRSGRPIEIDGTQRAKITALACSEAPKGYAKWTLRLLAERGVELEYCDEISHTQVANILKK